MIEERMYFFLFIFLLFSLQMILSFIQIKRYQRAVRELLGSGILGIGQRKGLLKPGEILILSYDRTNDSVICCKSMRGITIFASFREIIEYKGLTLAQIHKIAVEADAGDMKHYRKKHPYNPNIITKKKGALIQAVEAIERRIKNDADTPNCT